MLEMGMSFLLLKKKQCEWHSKRLGSLIPKWQGSAQLRKQHNTAGKLEMAERSVCRQAEMLAPCSQEAFPMRLRSPKVTSLLRFQALPLPDKV